MANVILEKVEKTYPNGFKAVHGIDLEIKENEFMVFVGPSGCAKSTTLRMIAGLEEITGGKIYIGDEVVNQVEPKDRGIAMVFQNYALYPHMTTYDNMAFGLKMQKVPKDEIKTRVEAAAERLQITDLLDRKPKEMSGGQKQRVAVGRAIVREPKVFLFDEPLSNLDAELRVSLRVSIKELHTQLKTEGKPATMIYVTHDQVEAMTMGDRICVMETGVIKQVDTPMNLYNYPANKFVATFIGSPMMNMLEVELEKDNNGIYCNIKACEGVKNCKDFKLYLNDDKAKKVESYVGKRVWLGFRPEAVKYEKTRTENTVTGLIDVIERMGNEEYIYFHINDMKLISREEANTSMGLNIGDEFDFRIDADKIHIFDMETEDNITL